MVSDLDAAWAAGFIDGEGNLSIYHRVKNGRDSYFISVSAVQVHQRPLFRLKEMFGGGVRRHHRESAKGWADSYRWGVSSRQAGAALVVLRPYLIVKDAQADLLLAFQARVLPQASAGMSLTQADQDERRELYEAVHRLNKTGVPKGVDVETFEPATRPQLRLLTEEDSA